MNTLNQLLGASPLEFASAFGKATNEASLWLEGGIAPAGAGFVWGHGQLSYQGDDHAFRLSGLSIAGLSSAGISALGSVTYLRKLADFGGHYVPFETGQKSAGSASGISLKNERGVLIKLISTDAGQPFDLPVNGLRIRLKRPL